LQALILAFSSVEPVVIKTLVEIVHVVHVFLNSILLEDTELHNLLDDYGVARVWLVVVVVKRTVFLRKYALILGAPAAVESKVNGLHHE